MTKTFNNILDIKNDFDVFFFDAYGVLWDGGEFYDKVKENLSKLLELNKTVFIISNTTKVSSSAESGYLKHGLIKNIHYNEVVTSGEFAKNILSNNELHFITNKNPKKCYIFGDKNDKLFTGSNYIVVDDINDADFIYISTVSLTKDEYNNVPQEYKKFLFQLTSKLDGSWRMTDLEPLIEKIENIIVKSKLPVLICNPDYSAINSVIGLDEKIATLTPGAIGKYLKDKGNEIVMTGKPQVGIYNFAFEKLKKYNSSIDKTRICMVGDTLRTDIKGANNAGIKSVLCVKTGITSLQINDGAKLDDLIKEENVAVDYFINSVGNY